MEDMRRIPLYRQTADYARERGELESFRRSNVANIACRAAIEEAIRDGFDGMRLQAGIAERVLQAFGAERVLYVLANSVQQKAWDGRFSPDNVAWARTFPIPEGGTMGWDHRSRFAVQSHPAVLDGFISLARKAALAALAPQSASGVSAAPQPRRQAFRGKGKVSMANRVREHQVIFRVTEAEKELIRQRMALLGTRNMQSFLRKMALDGYVVKLELPELKEMVSLLRWCSNNLNQIARRAHETGRIYDADLEDIAQRQKQLWEGVKEILTQLSNLS